MWKILIFLLATMIDVGAEAMEMHDFLQNLPYQSKDPSYKDIFYNVLDPPSSMMIQVWKILWQFTDNQYGNAFEAADEVFSAIAASPNESNAAALDVAVRSLARIPLSINNNQINHQEILGESLSLILARQYDNVLRLLRPQDLYLTDLELLVKDPLSPEPIFFEFLQRKQKFNEAAAQSIALKYLEWLFENSNQTPLTKLGLLLKILELNKGQSLDPKNQDAIIKAISQHPKYLPELVRLSPKEAGQQICKNQVDNKLISYYCLHIFKEDFTFEQLKRLQSSVIVEAPSEALFSNPWEDMQEYLKQVTGLSNNSQQLELLRAKSEGVRLSRLIQSDLIYDILGAKADLIKSLIVKVSRKDIIGNFEPLTMAFAEQTFELIRHNDSEGLKQAQQNLYLMMMELGYFGHTFAIQLQGQSELAEQAFFQVCTYQASTTPKFNPLDKSILDMIQTKKQVAQWLLAVIRTSSIEGGIKAKAILPLLQDYSDCFSRIWKDGGYIPLRVSPLIGDYSTDNFPITAIANQHEFYEALKLVMDNSNQKIPQQLKEVWLDIFAKVIADKIAKSYKPFGPTINEWSDAAIKILNNEVTLDQVGDLNSKYDVDGAPPKQVAVGLARISRLLQEGIKQEFKLKFKVPEIQWPFSGPITADCLLRVIENLNKYRGGAGVASLVTKIDSLVSDGFRVEEIDFLWQQAFNNLRYIQEVDIILNILPPDQFSKITFMPAYSYGWLYLCTKLNTNRPTVAERNKAIEIVANYLEEHANQDYPHRALAFMLLDINQTNYKKRLARIFDQYSDMLKSSALDDVNDKSEQERRHQILRLLRDLIIERLYQSGLKLEDYQDSTTQPLLEGLGRYIFMHVMKFPESRRDRNRIILCATLLGKDVANADKTHWEGLFELIENNKADLQPSEILRLTFENVKEREWKALAHQFGMIKLEAYIRHIRRDRKFMAASAIELGKVLQELIMAKWNISKDPAQDQQLVMARILDSLADGKNEALDNSLFASIKAFSENHDILAKGNPQEYIRLLFFPAEPQRQLVNPVTISAAIFVNLDDKTPEPVRDQTLRQALRGKEIPKFEQFRKVFEEYVLQVITPRTHSSQNAFFIAKFASISDEKQLMVLKLQQQSLPYIASLHLWMAMGKNTFDLLFKYLQDIPLMAPNSAGFSSPKDTNYDDELFVAMIRDAILQPTKLQEALDKTSTMGKIQPQLMSSSEVTISACGGRTFEQVKRKMLPKDISEACLQALSNEQRAELYSIPRVFNELVEKMSIVDLLEIPPILWSSLSAEQLTRVFSEEKCSLLASESIIRQVHFSLGGLKMLPPKCLQMAGPHWVLAFIPGPHHHSAISEEPLYPDALELSRILTIDNFRNLNIFLFAVAEPKIPPEFWDNLKGEFIDMVKQSPVRQT